jgi:hypothetical protein
MNVNALLNKIYFPTPLLTPSVNEPIDRYYTNTNLVYNAYQNQILNYTTLIKIIKI